MVSSALCTLSHNLAGLGVSFSGPLISSSVSSCNRPQEFPRVDVVLLTVPVSRCPVLRMLVYSQMKFSSPLLIWSVHKRCLVLHRRPSQRPPAGSQAPTLLPSYTSRSLEDPLRTTSGPRRPCLL